MSKIEFEKTRLDLKVTWAISRNSSQYKENLILNYNGAKSEIAPNIRYNESYEKAVAQVESIDVPEFQSVEDLESFVEGLDLSNSTRFGVESVLLQDLCLRQKTSIHELLNLNLKPIKTSFSLPIMEVSELESYLKEHGNFEVFKIKVNRSNAVEVVQKVQELTDKKLRIDANEDFQTAQEVLDFLKQVDVQRIEFLEQPLSSKNTQQQKILFKKSQVEIIADESIENDLNLEQLTDQFHGINVKLMKSGSVLKAYRQLRKARELGMKTMIGCMIETSVGISYALELCELVDYADLDGFLLIKKDPFQLIKNEKGLLTLK